MNISCKVIQDLLPLYHDNVCSPESSAHDRGAPERLRGLPSSGPRRTGWCTTRNAHNKKAPGQQPGGFLCLMG